MPFRLRRREPVADGMKRLARAQVRLVLACLTASEGPEPRQVHEARQRLKRLRAALRLLRGSLPQELASRGHAICRTTARSLSASRDAAVVQRTFKRLCESRKVARQVDVPAWERHLADVAHTLTAAVPNVTPTRPVVKPELIADLEAWHEEIARWPIHAGGWRLLAGGFEHTYRAGRRARREAALRWGAAEFHDWRKRVQDRWHHVRILRGMRRPELAQLAETHRRLARLLGRDHDWAMLGDWLNRAAGPEAERAVLKTHLTRAHDAVRRRALKLGARLWSQEPRRMEAEYHALWRAWHRQPYVVRVEPEEPEALPTAESVQSA
ncbi:MAG TPA: CHAD domain-containing protein [Gemmatales bacterium]|nr:CHAD domain-containing protein [Gemmatales bacterium]HMP58983.1 CHAD domain-containing protein [Gemmatales bacterium]